MLRFLGVPTVGLGEEGGRRSTGGKNAPYAVVCGYRFHYFIFRAPSSAGVRHAILAPWCFIYSLPRVTSSLPFYLSWLRWWIQSSGDSYYRFHIFFSPVPPVPSARMPTYYCISLAKTKMCVKLATLTIPSSPVIS